MSALPAVACVNPAKGEEAPLPARRKPHTSETREKIRKAAYRRLLRWGKLPGTLSPKSTAGLDEDFDSWGQT